MKRREFVAGLGSAAAWPAVARAQQPALPTVGLLNSNSPELSAPFVAAFKQRLSESGYVEGRNVTIEYRWAQGQYDRLPALARELVRRGVAVIVTPGSVAAALAAKAATATIPIVIGIGGDPVEFGVVASISRPGGNVTGVTSMNNDLASKRLGI